jgi:hypothetical protein
VLRDAGFDALAQYFPFKLGEYGQHTGQGSALHGYQGWEEAKSFTSISYRVALNRLISTQ